MVEIAPSNPLRLLDAAFHESRMPGDLTPVLTPEDRLQSEQLSIQERRPPAVVIGYELEHLLGEGAYGEVWVAMAHNLGSRVAIKFFNNRGGMDWSLLSREVEKLRFLKGDRYVVQLLEVGWNATPPYYVMEYMEGGSLEDQLANGLPSVTDAVALTREVATGLVHAHGKGILHCDLKPANILLDQDRNPRLADFGQARLLHESAAALGTLFYMAPEQADLNAVPDARWDVYALGAILFHLLTGQPPYRTEAEATQLRQAPNLPECLRRYRHDIESSPRPTAHRQVPGVDRPLADIIDRCLAVKPEKRFQDARAVLNALDARALQHARRPLLILGVLGPALLLLVLGLLAWRGFDTAVRDSEEALTNRALLNNQFAARFAAANVSRQMNQRWAILEHEAQQEELRKLLSPPVSKNEKDPRRQDLQRWLEQRHEQYRQTTAANAWFVLDAEGNMLAVSPLDPSRAAIGRNFAYRSYFHGGDRDYEEEERKTLQPKPTNHSIRSIVFESTAEGQPRIVVFSVPVGGQPGEPAGVLGMGITVGAFSELRPQDGEGERATLGGRWAILIETKKDWTGREGLILQHPWLESFAGERKQSPRVYLPQDLVEQLQQLRDRSLTRKAADETAPLIIDYDDPVLSASRDAGDRWSEAYPGRWLAAAEPVIIYPRKDSEKVLDTGWVVLVQERVGDALAPVQQLRGKLICQGIVSVVALFAVVGGLWGFVVLVLDESSRSRLSAFVRRRAGLKSHGRPGSTGNSAASTASRAKSTGAPRAP